MAVDSKAPIVKDFKFSTSLIDISKGNGTFSIELELSDALSGVQYVSIFVKSPEGKDAVASGIWNYTGTIQNPTYRETFTVNKFLDPGKYSVHVYLTDMAGNSKIYYLDAKLNVTNGADGFADGKTYYSGISKTISASFENLFLAGTDNLWGKGNAANNKIVGNEGSNKLYGLNGDDRLYGGNGNDTLIGGAGADGLHGGTGSDTASYADALKGVYVSLLNPSANTGDAMGDTYSSIENITGSSGADTLIGGAGANVLTGGDRNDVLQGDAGNDTIYGGSGADDLYGGAGKDIFVFKSTADSTVTSSGRDTIFDFLKGDRIDLKSIDAKAALAGDQAFVFLGKTGFTGNEGELRISQNKTDTYVYGDLNGDKIVDFAIHISGLVTFDKSDFIL